MPFTEKKQISLTSNHAKCEVEGLSFPIVHYQYVFDEVRLDNVRDGHIDIPKWSLPGCVLDCVTGR